jgi:hypothetical protein
MDNSVEYIEMCRVAEEIQEQKLHTDGNVFINFVSGEWQKTHVYTYGRIIPYDTGDYEVWLPRQDQLQEMVKMGFRAFVCDIYIFITDNAKYSSQFTSMEQLWLAFVMWEEYSKQWDGEVWVKRDPNT